MNSMDHLLPPAKDGPDVLALLRLPMTAIIAAIMLAGGAGAEAGSREISEISPGMKSLIGSFQFSVFGCAPFFIFDVFGSRKNSGVKIPCSAWRKIEYQHG